MEATTAVATAEEGVVVVVEASVEDTEGGAEVEVVAAAVVTPMSGPGTGPARTRGNWRTCIVYFVHSICVACPSKCCVCVV